MNNKTINDKYIIFENGKILNLKTNKLLKYYIHKTKGYYYVNINTKTVLLHRIIAQTFIPNPNNYLEVNHIDANKANNNISNLEWCTAKQNTQHALKNGLREKTTGKSVINNITNKIYSSMFKAWESSNKEFSYTHFKYILNSKFKNKTNYKFN